VYQVRVRNAAALADELRLRGDAGGAGWSVRYFDRAEGGSDVTDQMTRAEGRLTGVLQPGETQDLRVEVTPLGEQEVSRSRTVTLRATPRRGSPAMDAVRTVTTCPPAHRPDLMIRNPQDPEYLGQGIFNLTGAGQTKAQTRPPGATATFQFRVRNGALARDRCRIMGPAGAAQTRARYFEAASGGREITGPVTGWGWATPWLAPGETRDLRVEVSPLLGQARDVPVTLAIVAKSLAAPTVMDVVAASVTWSAAGGSSAARLSSLCAVPTPTGAAVTFSLSSPAQVDARILNLAGRPIRALCRDRACEAGPNTLAWDGRADNGLRVPAGSYLVEIIARTPEGTQSRNVRAVVAGR
jgi:hypothetical protein